MRAQLPFSPDLPTLARLGLALAIGLFVGIERERRRKEAGLRTFAFAAVLGAVGGLLGQPYALLALALLGVLVILLNIETIRTGEGAEITTSGALFVVGFAGVLCGVGRTFAPTVLGVATAALLAWKEPLAGFSQALTESELRSAVLLAILAFVIYPVLPSGFIDRWDLIDARAAWVTVILIAALGFANYILLKLYGARGIALTGFLGGLVNSTLTVSELASRARDTGGALVDVTYRGVLFATGAMLVRNTVILGLLAPGTVGYSLAPMALMLAAIALLVRIAPNRHDGHPVVDPPAGSATVPEAAPADVDEEARTDAAALLSRMSSPFSLMAALKFGLIFLALQVAGTLAQRVLGHGGFYGVSVVGGLVSSASAVASAANLAAAGTLLPGVAAVGAIAASATSAIIDVPIVARVAQDRALTRRTVRAVIAIMVAAAIGIAVQTIVW